MAFEIPSSLIREIQIALRNEAGVSSYDPTDPTLPNLPTLEEAISALDPSLPPYLRCKRCRGGLLRGLQSTICIYCGAEQGREGLPQTISFNSTVGYRRLLESLDLDGSEAIALDTESSGSRKGQDAPKDGLVLSGLLDLEVRWPLEKEKIDNSSTNKAPARSTYSLNLSGIDLDNFFSESKPETASSAPRVSEEQLIPKKQITNTETHALSGIETFGFAENQPSDVAVSSMDCKGSEFGDSFAVWEAEFQSSSSQTTTADSKSVDLFQGSTSEFASPVETAATFNQHKDIEFEAEFQSASSQNITTDSKSVDLFQDSSTFEFARPVGAVATFNQRKDIEFDSRSKGNSGENKTDEGQVSLSNNWNQDDLWHGMNTQVFNTVDQFKSSREANNGEPKSNLNSRTSISDSSGQDDLWPTSSVTESLDTKKINGDDDVFDAWQDFTSSGDTPGGLSNTLIQTGIEGTLHEHASETKSVGLHDMEFGSFLHSDSFSGALGGQKSASDVNNVLSEASISDRMNGMHARTGADSKIWGEAGNDENFTSATHLESSKSNVERLLSQMHDLSFMLESDLSIPKKVESSDVNF